MKTTTKAPRATGTATKSKATAPKQAAVASKAPRTAAAKTSTIRSKQQASSATATKRPAQAASTKAAKRPAQAASNATQARSRTAATKKSIAPAATPVAATAIRSRAIAGRSAEAILGDIELAFQKQASSLSGQARGAAMRAPKKLVSELRGHVEALSAQARRREAQLTKLTQEAKTLRGGNGEAASRSEAIAPDALGAGNAPQMDSNETTGTTPTPPVNAGQDAAIASAGRNSAAE